MPSKLGPHAIGPTAGARALIDAGCNIVKLLDDFGLAPELAAKPGLTLIGRSFSPFTAESQRGETPEAAARRFVESQQQTYRLNPDIKIWEGHNEPVWTSREDMAWYAEFEIARLRMLADLGLRGVIGNFATGNPGDLNLWQSFIPAVRAAKQFGGILGLHEYSSPWIWWMTGNFQINPNENEGDEGWVTLRYRKVVRQFLRPAGVDDVQIAITEFGLDRVAPVPPGASSGNWRTNAAWWGQWDGAQTESLPGDPIDYWRGPERDGERYYAEQMLWYDREIRKDPNVLGATIFTVGANNPAFANYDINGTRVLNFLADYIRREADVPDPEPAPVPSPPPPTPQAEPMLYGKAVWAWPESDVAPAIELAKFVGARYIFYHVLTFRPPDANYDSDAAPRVARQIRDAGLWPLAWYAFYLNNASAPRNEAMYARRAIREDGYLGAIFDAEANSLTKPEGKPRAAQMAQFLINDFGLDPKTLFFSSFPNILSHLDKRFDEFMPATARGGLMPMCYGTFLRPPSTVITEWGYGHRDRAAPRWGWVPPVYPILGTYRDEQGNDQFTPAQFAAWLEQLRRNSATFVSIYRATKFDRRLWEQFRDYEPTRPDNIYRFPGETVPPPPLPQRWVIARPSLNVRSSPRVPAPGEPSNRIGNLPFGTQVSLLPDPPVNDNAGRVWVRIQFGDLIGWCAQSQNGEPFLSDRPPDTGPAPGDGDGDVPRETLWVQPGIGMALRDAASSLDDNSDWLEGTVIPPGTFLTAIGPTVAREDRLYQRVRLTGGAQGWVAAERMGEVYLADSRQGDERQALVTELTVGLRLYSRPEAVNEAWLTPIILWTGLPVRFLRRIQDPDSGGRCWIRVQCPDGQRGWVIDCYADGPSRLTTTPPTTVTPTRDLDLLERPADGGGGQAAPQRPVRTTVTLNIRTAPARRPDTQFMIANAGTRLTAVGDPLPPDAENIRWQRLRWSDGTDKWASAFFLADIPPAVVSRVATGAPLFVLRRVGVNGDWLHVRSLAHKEGYLRAMDTQAVAAIPEKPPVSQVPHAESPFIFAIHDQHESENGLSMYVLPDGTRRTGWVVITEEVGNRPEPGRRHDEYARWADRGFGVIVRLNHGYGSTGTIPDPNDAAKTEGFIQACATWVQNSGDGCHIWIIGNEVNNPREWPRNAMITPAAYANVFNRARDAIRQGAHQNDIVCPAPIDPYNAQFGDSRLYFADMLRNIRNLDGLILHAYTHTPELTDITHTQTFGNAPLLGQYFDFQVFRNMLDLIPSRWRNVPVFMTETDILPLRAPDGSVIPPWSRNADKWVPAAYAEIQRWNAVPAAQQIRCLALFRWELAFEDGLTYGFSNKPEVRAGYVAAVKSDWRWRA
jgi:hypothetical protein